MPKQIESLVPLVRDVFFVNRSNITVKKEEGTTVEKVAVATYDVAVDGGGVGAHALGVYIPTKAVILDAWVDVVTTFTDGDTDAATIALHIQSANDLVSAIAISDATNVWDAGIHGTLVTAPNLGADAAHDSALEVIALMAATKIKTTAIRQITATVATAALTAGKMNVYVKYVISD